MNDLEAKIKAGMDKFAGVENVPLAPIPEEYTRKRNAEELEKRDLDMAVYGTGAVKVEGDTITHVPLSEIVKEPSILELAEQQAREALIRDSIDRYKIVRDALENCLAQAQHMRDDPATAKEALKQIEMIAVAALGETR